LQYARLKWGKRSQSANPKGGVHGSPITVQRSSIGVQRSPGAAFFKIETTAFPKSKMLGMGNDLKIDPLSVTLTI
jgi:hypothetical protein